MAKSPARIKVVAFDVFGTVFDLSGVDREEVRSYVKHIHEPEWRPLALPTSWESLPAHSDSAGGIARLRDHFQVVTCSNGPISLLAKISKRAGISWDALIPLEVARVYKPNPRAYELICEVMRVAPEEIAFVTANATFGDLEASAKLGMSPILIRHEKSPVNITALAELLICGRCGEHELA